MELLLQYTVSGFFLGSIYALVALGIVLIYKATHVFNFAQGHFLMVGVLLGYIFISKFGVAIAIPLTIVCGAGIGYLLERFALRPLIGQSVISALLMTLALAYFIDAIATIFWGTTVYQYPRWFPVDFIPFGPIHVSTAYLYSILVAIVIFGGFMLFYRRSGLGMAMRATAEDHQVSQSLGIRVKQIFTLTWVLAAVIAFAMSFFFGVHTGAFRYLSDYGWKAIPAVLVGGLDSFPGAIVGGLIVGFLEVVACGQFGAGVGGAFPFIVLLLVIIVKPYGLFGEVRIERV